MNAEKLKLYRCSIDRQIRELDSSSRSLFSGAETAESFPDLYDRAAHEYDSGCRLIFRDRERKLTVRLRGAVSRMEKGVYGKCEACGIRIPEKRMRANPLAVLCIDCQKKEEKVLSGKNP